jgi:hypothetical protein
MKSAITATISSDKTKYGRSPSQGRKNENRNKPTQMPRPAKVLLPINRLV